MNVGHKVEEGFVGASTSIVITSIVSAPIDSWERSSLLALPRSVSDCHLPLAGAKLANANRFYIQQLHCALRFSLSMPMAPRHNSAPVKNRRQPTTDPRKKNLIVKSTWRAGTRSSARLQHIQPPPTPPALTSQLAHTKRKRPQLDSEAEADEPKGVRLAKQLRGFPPPLYELSEENLQEDSKAEADEPGGLRLSEELQEIPPQARPVRPSPPFLHPSLSQSLPNGSVRKTLKLKPKLIS